MCKLLLSRKDRVAEEKDDEQRPKKAFVTTIIGYTKASRGGQRF
jgi:hypothetical protein